MRKILNSLKNKRAQYVVIVWILLVKVIEISAELLANIELLQFFEILGFSHLSTSSRMVWDALVAITIVWLIYRLAKDMFQISLGMRSLSKRDILSIMLFLAWSTSSAIATLQFAQIASLPPASPNLEISKYYSPCNTIIDAARTYFIINDSMQAEVILDLSKSMFTAPFSFYQIGEISMFGVRDGGLSYFSLKNSSIGQKMIEIRFFGNGTNGLSGWFANKITLEKPLKINETTTLILLLKLEPSSDNTAWTYIKLDILSCNGKDLSLVWKFHDKQINSIISAPDNKTKIYLLGSTMDWTLLQLNLQNVFYTCFSDHAHLLCSIEYGVGAEADNVVTVTYILAKISDYPLKVNGELVESVKPSVKVAEYKILFEGVETFRLYVTLILKPYEENRCFQLFPAKISRLEQYKWSFNSPNGEIEERIRFKPTNFTKIFLNGNEVFPKTSIIELSPYDFVHLQGKMILTIINEINTNFMPMMSLILTPLTILYFWKLVKFKRKGDE